MVQYQLSYAGPGSVSYSNVAPPQISPQPSPLEMLAYHVNNALQTAGHYVGNSLTKVVRDPISRLGELYDYLTTYVGHAQELASNILFSKNGGAKAGHEERIKRERAKSRNDRKSKQLKPGGKSKYAKKKLERG